MSLLESPIRIHGNKADGPEPMLLIGAVVRTKQVGEVRQDEVLYICVDADGDIHELTSDWVNVDWRWTGGPDWLDLSNIGREAEDVGSPPG